MRQRGRRNLDAEDEELMVLRMEYMNAKSELRTMIAKAKAKAWADLLLLIDEDPWGLPFKIVTGKLRKSTPFLTELLDEADRGKILAKLFPPGETHDPTTLWKDVTWEDHFEVTYMDVDRALRRRPVKGAAPGPDGITDKVLKLIPDAWVDLLAKFYSKCLHDGTFPKPWKIGRLVLIPKPSSSDSDGVPKSRPICVLDELGKALERIIHQRINSWLGDNPAFSLSSRQYGFVECRSTTDALRQVTEIIESAFSRKQTVVAVSVDIENAFNSLPWPTIRKALWEKQVPTYLCRIIDSYLYQRAIVYPTARGYETRTIQAGVPQGSVIGPLLWNVGYDVILHKDLEVGSHLICYADDTLILSEAKSAADSLSRASLQTHRILHEIRRLGLRVAARKTEVALFSREARRRNARSRHRHSPSSTPSSIQDTEPEMNEFKVENDSVQITDHFKYLGVILDKSLTFNQHFEYAINKASGVMGALTGLMPNLRGPCENKRKLFANVALSVLLYGAPVWSTYLYRNEKMITRMNRSIHLICNRIIGGYRTIALDAATLLARIPPVSLQADYRRRVYERIKDLHDSNSFCNKKANEIKREENLLMLRQWEISLSHAKYGTRTIEAILPHFSAWMSRKTGSLEFHLTQILTGHGAMGAYLYRIQRADSPNCLACNEGYTDTAEHTLKDCSRWTAQRDDLTRVIGADLNLQTVILKMLESKDKWRSMITFAKSVMLTKEDEERARQACMIRLRSMSVRSSTDDT